MARLPGFEPGLEAWEARKNRSSEKLFESFEEFCLIDLKLKQVTVDKHIESIRRLQRALDKSLVDVSTQDLRSYLRRNYLNKASNTYANEIKSFRVFFRDFLGAGHLVESFRLPRIGYVSKVIPSKEQLQRFYWTLETLKDKTLFLMLATTGLRKEEVLSLSLEDLDRTKRTIIPKNHQGNDSTKRSWVSFYNEEAAEALERFLALGDCHTSRIFGLGPNTNLKTWKKAAKKTGINITPQILREWFAEEMSNLNVSERYIDALCGRTPKSVLARHYTDYAPEKLREVYEKAGLKVIR